MTPLVAFADFIDATRSARFEEYADALCASAKRHGLHIDAEAEFRRMKDYLLDFYQDVRPLRSLLGADSHPVDCVPFEAQPGVRLAARAGHNIQMIPPIAALPGAAQAETDPA